MGYWVGVGGCWIGCWKRMLAGEFSRVWREILLPLLILIALIERKKLCADDDSRVFKGD